MSFTNFCLIKADRGCLLTQVSCHLCAYNFNTSLFSCMSLVVTPSVIRANAGGLWVKTTTDQCKYGHGVLPIRPLLKWISALGWVYLTDYCQKCRHPLVTFTNSLLWTEQQNRTAAGIMRVVKTERGSTSDEADWLHFFPLAVTSLNSCQIFFTHINKLVQSCFLSC